MKNVMFEDDNIGRHEQNSSAFGRGCRYILRKQSCNLSGCIVI